MRKLLILWLALFVPSFFCSPAPAQPLGDGQECVKNSDCATKKCGAGPGASPGEYSSSYCMSKKAICSFPKQHGTTYGFPRFLNQESYMCALVDNYPPHFIATTALLDAHVRSRSSFELYYFTKLSGGVGHGRDCTPSVTCNDCLTKVAGICVVPDPQYPICEGKRSLKKIDCERLKTSEILLGRPLRDLILLSRSMANNERVYPMPSQIRKRLKLFFPSETLRSVRYRVGTNIPVNLQKIALDWNNNKAITLGNVIVFANESAARNLCTWAHEVEHVLQYEKLGIDQFAERYMQPGKRGNYNPEATGTIEGSATAREQFVCRFAPPL
ncbi:MAG: DUF4157 domain-containing protein [Mesorhizobium sp.]|nr:MAG: DUF4157 domain-containing protein [Mesorhizobium sp.]